jgi:hypothetical protein
MKLFNSIVVFDVYCVAEDELTALEAVQMHITNGLPASEGVSREVREDKHVRESWREQTPLVANDVSDEDFEQLRGKTVLAVYKMLHVKDPIAAK